MSLKSRWTVFLGAAPWFCALALVAAGSASACTVPVFQWAMDNWEADIYRLYVFHTEPLSEEVQATLAGLAKSDASEANRPVNVEADVVDLNGWMKKKREKVWEAQASATPPWLVLRHPKSSRPDVDVWSGPLTEESLRTVLDSPARQEIARRLMEKDVPAVWVLLDSGDAEKDAAATKALEAALGKVPKSLDPKELGTATTNDERRPDYSFPLVRVRRDDPAEAVFTSVLLHTEPDLSSYAEPMAFPVFGRGRALYALVGAGINEDTVGEACRFTAGSCSCIVKDQNPGVDLLVSADWKAVAEEQMLVEYELDPAQPTESLAVQVQEASPPPPAPVQEVVVNEVSPVPYAMLALGISFAVVVTLTAAAVIRRRTRASR